MKKDRNEVFCRGNERIKKCVGEFIKDEEGLGVVELVLIIIILIGLVILFKEQVTDFIKDLFKDATENKEQF